MITDQSAWVATLTTVRFNFCHVLNCLLVEPWQNIIMENLLIEAVPEMTDIAKVSERVDFKATGEVLAKDSANDFFVGHNFSRTSTALQTFLSNECFKTLRFSLFHLYDLTLFILTHRGETLLLTLHLSNLFFLKDLHASYFKRFTAEDRQDRLNFVLE